MLTLAEARRVLEEAFPAPAVEEVPLPAAAGRFLAEDVVAAEDVPGFDRAAMDGYAVRAAELASASPSAPVRLRVTGAVRAGLVAAFPVGPGEAVAVATGAPLPPGADAIVRWEETRPAGGGAGFAPVGSSVEVLAPVRPRQNVSPRGEDVRAGHLVLRRGDTLDPAAVGVLASLGRWRVPVFARPPVVVQPTGDEVVPVEARPGPGQVRDSTAWALAAAVAEAGGDPAVLAPVPDEEEAIAEAVAAAWRQGRLVFTTGGVSVGQRDLLRRVAERLGARVLFWRLPIRPGKNVLAAAAGDRLLVGLSGNPAACLVAFDLLVRPALARLAGDPDGGLVSVPAVLGEPVRRLAGFARCLRVRLEPGPGAGSAAAGRGGPGGPHEAHGPMGLPVVRLAGSQLGTVLSSLAGADGYCLLASGEGEAPAGEPVEALVHPGRGAGLLRRLARSVAAGSAGGRDGRWVPERAETL